MDDSAQYPRVTEVLREVGVAPSYEGIDPAVVSLARERGIAIDRACDLIDIGDLDFDSVDDRLLPYLRAYQKFLDETGYIPEASQQAVVHTKYRYRGTCDMRGRIHGGRLIADRKCTASLHPATALQVAAYKLAHEHQHPFELVDMIAGLHLRKNGTYVLCPYTSIDYVEHTWVAAVTVYHNPEDTEAQAVINAWKRTHP